MTQTFTVDDLILYYYQELPEEKKMEVKNLLVCDHTLSEEYESLKTVFSGLNRMEVCPSARSVEKILSYSRK